MFIPVILFWVTKVVKEGVLYGNESLGLAWDCADAF